MRTHYWKLDRANVVGVFDTQDEAEDAVLGLRMAGFKDDQIGYLAQNLAGQITDFVGRTYAFAGLVIGTVLGAAFGVWAGQESIAIHASQIGPAILSGDVGLLVTTGICGALLLGFCGALVGWGVPRDGAIHVGTEVESGRYVLAVNAGSRTAEVWALLRQYGGRPPQPAEVEAPAHAVEMSA